METKSNLFQTQTVSGLALVLLGLSLVSVTAADSTFSDANWSSMGGVPGVDGGVRATAVDGSGNLYIAGFFSRVGDVMANSIAKWNGNSWSALGSGMEYDVMALAVSGGDVYAAGAFSTAGGNAANRIAKWDGSKWSPLGPGLHNTVWALAVSGNDVYAGGYFGVAKWDGSTWSPVGGMNNWVYSLAVSGTDVYVGGYFTNVSGVAANHIAKWNGSSWSALGSGLDSDVYALAVSGSDVYAAGPFSTAGGNAANRIAKWNGSSWSALGSGLGGVDYPCVVSVLAVLGNDLYAAGCFTKAGDRTAHRIAKWDGTNWSALSSGMNNGVYSLSVSGSALYAGGGFTAAGGSAANGISRWDGNRWSALASGSGISGGGGFRRPPVKALAVSGGNVYAGGNFTTAGSAEAYGVAQWNGSNWSSLGLGVNVGDVFLGGNVSALAVAGGDLYAAGGFLNAPNSDGEVVAVRNIAKWDGNRWSTLGSGLDLTEDSCCAEVKALAVSGSDLYAGGYFTTAGGVAATNIAKWNGNSWSALGSGLGGIDYPVVSALAVSGSDLYVGGSFTTAGGIAATNIAKWNGSSWSALGLGIVAAEPSWPGVIALAVSGNNLYVGGNFITAGGSQAYNIAKWDGNSWSALGLGLNGFVWALAVSGDNVYVGGHFTTAGGIAAVNIARWNGSSWSALGSGLNVGARALALSGNDLYVGGLFDTAGGKVSAHIARAYLLDIPTLSVRRFSADVEVSWPSVDTVEFTLEQTAGLAASSNWLPNTTRISDNGTEKSVTLPATNSRQFFRLRR